MDQTQQQQRQSKRGSITYNLFLYREELRRRNAHYLRLSHAKFFLTDGLISKKVTNIQECNVEELKAINRELMFKKKLKMQIHRIRVLQELGIQNANPNGMATVL